MKQGGRHGKPTGDADDAARLDLEGLDPDRWTAIDRVLEVVLELPNEEIEGALDRLCDGTPGLRTQVQAVLRADRSASGFLSRSALGLLKPE